MTGPALGLVDEVFDVILSRPGLLFGSAAKLPKSVLSRAATMEKLLGSSKRQLVDAHRMEQFLLPQGKTVFGGFPQDELVGKLGIQPIISGGVDQTPRAMRDLTGTVRMDWSEQGILKMDLPRRVTDEQVKHLSRFFDNNQIPTVQLFDPAGQPIVLSNPVGAQVEDAIYNATGKYAKKTSRITPSMVEQYKKTGVFKGQAAILVDGSPVEIRAKSGFTYTIFDPTAGKEVKVHQSKITPLFTTLEDQLKPNNVFNRYMPEDERLALAKMRKGLEVGLGQPIKKFGQLETLAGSRGFIAERLNRGKVAIVDALSGERQQFDNIESAVASVRQSNRPAPDLTPDELKNLLGDGDNVGFVGMNGSPPRFGDQIPIPTHIVMDQRVANDLLPGALEKIVKPMRALFQDMEQRTGLPFGSNFLNIQEATVQRQNFNARWIHGKGRPLPNQTTSLDKIMKIAGKDADESAITAWLESGADAAARTRLEGTMTANEIKAAGELRKWYDEMFKEMGVQADYMENYVPHWRSNASKYGNDIYEIWRATNGDIPLPQGARFFADYYRTGVLDVYDTNAFRMAARYAHAGSSNRFMSKPLDEVGKFLHQVPDRALTKPMSEYLEALRGVEFLEQKQAIERTLGAVFDRLPGIDKVTSRGLADKLSDLAIGTGYMSTLAYRFPAAMRNYAQILHTTYPIFGNADGAFVNGIGRALTKAGKLAAAEDGAISYKSASVFGRQEFDETLPRFKKFADTGFKLYDSADEFTRATTYWVARENTMNAISKYSKRADIGNPAKAQRALDKLLLDSKVYMFEDNIQKEFLRRMVQDPEQAARFIGKQMADVTQFLYGRGMQPYWMRSTFGKFLGQYGTWSLWYIDYVTRTTKNLRRNGHTAEAVKFLGRNALVNGALLYAGQEVLDVDMSRWLSYPAVFYSGGPGTQVLIGMTQMFRGLADVTAGSESEFAKSHLTEGIHTLARTGLAYIPFRSAARDVQRVTEAIDNGNYTEFLAAMLGTRPTEGYTIQQQLDALFPGGPLAYEEWLRHVPDAPVGPSASALSEVELYRAVQGGQSLQTRAPGMLPGPSAAPSQPGTPGSQGATGQPPNPQSMGLPQARPQGGQTLRSQSARVSSGGMLPIPPTPESSPLER